MSRQEKTSRISRPCDEKGNARGYVDNRKDRRKKKQRSSKNKNTRRYSTSSLAGKKHCGDVCGCKRSQNVESQDRLRLQQTRQLKKKKNTEWRYADLRHKKTTQTHHALWWFRLIRLQAYYFLTFTIQLLTPIQFYHEVVNNILNHNLAGRKITVRPRCWFLH